MDIISTGLHSSVWADVKKVQLSGLLSKSITPWSIFRTDQIKAKKSLFWQNLFDPIFCLKKTTSNDIIAEDGR